MFKTDDPYWKADARIANVSANGLLLRMGDAEDLVVGSRVAVRFGTAAVSGHVRHVSAKATCVLVGVEIQNLQFLH